ncbi:MAG: MarR family transcriptional regulator [Haliea sp.]|uniref:Rieske 2Fe-2S domain-containing protein n=1 Tax=Haliea sp. TaxID=1932666 RepID=UPI000C411A83|nr:Rieske 2Fe-2S domain-containing protein [Haliea sp.]MBM69221.1 MarR family transcriptional regulator [Haliea sp.]|tara:strand:+ start:1097 stop:2383 length:1287 start_codon:yes stop_codon:yes gene_type:complete
MLTPAENDMLCRVEGDAPMGQVMRYYWMPACLSEEIAEPDGKPIRVRLLGENFVAFRDSDGEVGVMDELCPHRRASLVLGRNEECGLRCLYHGWKIDRKGNVLDMPSEPEESPLKNKVKHRSLPVKEWAGAVWVYLGDSESVPPFEPPAWAPQEDTKVSIAKINIPCNWAQILEGAIDSAHSSSLHSSDMVPARVIQAEADDNAWYRPSTDKNPSIRAKSTESGFHYAAIRRPIKKADTHSYVRTSVFVAPMTVLIPPNGSYNVANINVPIDDENTAFHFIAWGDNAPDVDNWRSFLGASPGEHLDDNWFSKRQAHNWFLQDRKAMKEGSYTGIQGIPNQDMAMWVTMGKIADRSCDTLGASDGAVVEFRRYMMDQLNRFVEEGAAAYEKSVFREHGAEIIPSWQGVIPKDTDWSNPVERDEHKLMDW